MSTTFPPNWTDNTQIIAPYALVKGSATALQTVRGTLDLRAKRGAYLFLAIGTGGSTAIVSPCNVLVRRVLNNGSAAHRYSSPLFQASGRTTAGVRLINNGSNYAAGVQSFAYDGAAGTAHAVDDKLFFWGVTAIPVASGALSPSGGCEVLRCAGGTSTPLITDVVSNYAHNDNEVIGNADVWNLWVPGGSLIEVVFDYTAATAGEAVAVMADAQVYNYDTKGTV